MKHNKKKKIILSVLAIIIIIIVTGTIYIYNALNKVKTKSLNVNNLDITKSQNNDYTHNVKNILLLGVDNEETASDTNIILTIDNNKHKIKISSIMRDTYVNLGKGRPITKLNYAYHYGGPELSVKTINNLFKLDIKNYIKVDFNGLIKIIDSIGGVPIKINDDECNTINRHAMLAAKANKTTYTPLNGAGTYNLNGVQAIAYCRFRSDKNFDYGRTQRQRLVINQILKKLSNYPITEYPKTLNNILPNIETSLTKKEILETGLQCSMYIKNGIAETRCPYNDLKSDETINGIYYMKWDQNKNVEKLHKFIYS
ncbi:MAG: LCP family protein [Clostridiaceae bacterium]|nr:LCP family protein [Clostridiaceae bacterium]